MLIAVSVIYLTLIFPIFVNVSGKISFNEKKANFSVSIYNLIKIINGFAKISTTGIILKINKSNKKILYKNLVNFRKKFKPLKDYHLISFYSRLELGSKQDLIKSLEISFLYNYVFQNVKWFYYHKKPYLRLKNSINIYDNKTFVDYFFNGTVVFNLLMVIISVIKILVEKIVYAITRKQQNKPNNERFA